MGYIQCTFIITQKSIEYDSKVFFCLSIKLYNEEKTFFFLFKKIKGKLQSSSMINYLLLKKLFIRISKRTYNIC